MAASAVTLPPLLRVAGAQNYPIRPVRWVVGFPPGGPNDITARVMAEFLSERLHQQFAVENRPGAASNIATESVARSQPDGYTVMELATVNAINASLYENLNYDLTRDIVLVAGFGQGPAVIEILNKEVNDVLVDPRLKARFADLGITPMTMTPAECQRFIIAETQKWAKVIKFAGIKPE